MNKEHIKSLIGEGKLTQAVDELTTWTQNSADKDTNRAILQLAQRHNTNENNNYLGNTSQSDYLMERNRISLALLVITEGGALDGSKSKIKPNWVGIIGFFVALIAVIANIGTIKDTFFKKDAPKVVAPSVEPQKETPKSLVMPDNPPKVVLPAATAPMKGKNNTQINVHGNGKVGSVITGDSNKVDIHQNF